MTMRILDPAILPVLNPEISNGGHRDDIQCEEDSNCDLAAGDGRDAASDGDYSDKYTIATTTGLVCED